MERISGLPIQEQVYDEYVPTNEELEDPEVKHGQLLKALLNCYQYLRDISPVDNVSFEMSMEFFFHRQHHRIKSKGKHKSKSFDITRMADSRKPYSLVVPALCTLYREINYWVIDHLAMSCNWPVHYLVRWISQYFPDLYDQLPKDEIEMQFPSSNHRLDLEGGDDHILPASIAPQGSQSLHKVHDKNVSSTKGLDIFKDYREPTSSGNSSDEDETQAKTNDSLSSHENISKQDTPIQQDQIMVIPQMNSKASGSNSSVEQAI
ncbi:uncharacterized protein A4U43_C09F13690 [Asparagus officinalis]|uniref:Aminotransferase-like plant mobile domain-containing protein n=1 Tax=Asparagus officinalis TaxID=4686 RepID=A0A5P1E7G0_ASPOF|nr:uncharacterized protein A4U43_C09F13690 [Asparagus officinalis]